VPTRRIAAGVAFGVGGLSVIASAVFGGVALAKKGSLNATCLQKGQFVATGCPETDQPTIDAMNGFAAASTTAIVVAVASVGVGTTLLLIGPHTQPAGSVAVSFGAGGAGLGGTF
jgi:hypothetical protein